MIPELLLTINVFVHISDTGLEKGTKTRIEQTSVPVSVEGHAGLVNC